MDSNLKPKKKIDNEKNKVLIVIGEKEKVFGLTNEYYQNASSIINYEIINHSSGHVIPNKSNEVKKILLWLFPIPDINDQIINIYNNNLNDIQGKIYLEKFLYNLVKNNIYDFFNMYKIKYNSMLYKDVIIKKTLILDLFNQLGWSSWNSHNYNSFITKSNKDYDKYNLFLACLRYNQEDIKEKLDSFCN